MKTFTDHLIEAHRKTGAPGRRIVNWEFDVTGVRGYYWCQLQYGRKRYIFKTQKDLSDPRVTVECNWTIDGAKQRRTATSTKESA